MAERTKLWIADKMKSLMKMKSIDKIRITEICQAAENDWEQVNVTLGIAVYDSENDPAVIDVARRADQQMYENKRIRKEKRRKMS
jgi:GGDEF domain-containing protein